MTWKNYICDISDKKAQVLVDQRFEKQAPINELSKLSWLGIYCKENPGNSFWNPRETETLDNIENELFRICERVGNGSIVYILRIATPGIREYYFYHSLTVEFTKVFEDVKSIYPTYRIETETTDDPQWNEYKKYVNFG